MSQVIITCEHAKNVVPELVKKQFQGKEELLQSHRGLDIGALALAHSIAKQFHAELIIGEVSRLVVDLNRSIGNRSLYYDTVKTLPKLVLDEILNTYYFPYRRSVSEKIAKMIKRGRVLHLSIHSFTPVFDGIKREVDLGLLYDPKRELERLFCKKVKAEFHKRSNALCYMNKPYKGISDGFVTALRHEFRQRQYIGIEIEMNQKFALNESSLYDKKFLEPLLKSLYASI